MVTNSIVVYSTGTAVCIPKKKPLWATKTGSSERLFFVRDVHGDFVQTAVELLTELVQRVR